MVPDLRIKWSYAAMGQRRHTCACFNWYFGLKTIQNALWVGLGKIACHVPWGYPVLAFYYVLWSFWFIFQSNLMSPDCAQLQVFCPCTQDLNRIELSLCSLMLLDFEKQRCREKAFAQLLTDSAEKFFGIHLKWCQWKGQSCWKLLYFWDFNNSSPLLTKGKVNEMIKNFAFNCLRALLGKGK